jgi:DNA polymerase-1
MKKAMVDTWKSGVCDVIGVPLLTVHDENCFSVPRTKEGEEAIWEAKRIMENAIKLEVPVLTDIEVGQDWGHVDLAKRNFV